MKISDLLNSFLQNFYSHFAPPLDTMDQNQGLSFYESVIAPSLHSPEYKARLIKEPEVVLAELGIVLPEGMVIKFLENTEDTIHIVIPPYVGE